MYICKYTVTTTPTSTIQDLFPKTDPMPGLTTVTVTITATSCYMAETTSFTMNSTPDNSMVDQSLQSDGSLSAWMAVAIVLLVIAVSAIFLSIFVGYFSHKKMKTLEISLAAVSSANNKELHTQGKLSGNKQLRLTYGHNILIILLRW